MEPVNPRKESSGLPFWLGVSLLYGKSELCPALKKIKMIFKIAVSGISVSSSEKSYEALDSFPLSFRPAFY